MEEWISVKDKLPDKSKVIAYYKNSHGKGRMVMAEYVAPFTVKAEDFYDDWCDESLDYKDDDCEGYVKESWHEVIDNWGDFSSVHICEGEVTHWMWLPRPPTGES